MRLFKLFAYVFVFAIVVATMLCDYPPTDFYGYLTVGAIVAGAALLFVLSLDRAYFWVEIENPYIVGGWVSLALFLYLLMYSVPTGQELYTFFILAAAALVGLLNIDKPRYVLIQHEPRSGAAFARGIIWGLLAYSIANLLLLMFVGFEESASILRAMFVGPITSQLSEWLDIGIEFLIMLFVVAVPEELMARVFYLRMGSAVTDVYTASLLTLVSGYAMHAVTRYSLDYGSLVLFVLTVVWLLLSVAYMRHGLLASIAAHATYNTMITASIYGYSYAIGAALAFIVIAYTVLGMKRQPVFI